MTRLIGYSIVILDASDVWRTARQYVCQAAAATLLNVSKKVWACMLVGKYGCQISDVMCLMAKVDMKSQIVMVGCRINYIAHDNYAKNVILLSFKYSYQLLTHPQLIKV